MIIVRLFCSRSVNIPLTQNVTAPAIFSSTYEVTGSVGRAIAQAVSRWLPTAAAQVRARAWQVGFVVDKVAIGQVFHEYFGFPCQFSFHQILYHHNHPGQVQ
jgi:hypothetical protein